MAVVAHQHHGFKPPIRSPKCRLPSFTHFDFFTCEPNQIDTTHALGPIVLIGASFPRSVSTPCLTLTSKVEEEVNNNPRVQLIGGQTAPRVRALVVEVAIAIASGVDSVPISSGLGGAYLLHNRNGDTIAVAKPIDEEPLALNNPKGFAGRMLGQPGLKRSIRVGETGIRELAAYLLDHHGFAGVPPTGLVKFSDFSFHVNNLPSISSPVYKIASLQKYVDHYSDAGDLGPSGFSVSSVHRIGILDVRLLNIDRHSGNLLVKKHQHDNSNKYSLGVTQLIPIDHGLCLPEWLDDPYFEWLHWPQASVPFSETEMEYISNLDPFEDAKLLRTQIPCLNESSIRVLIVCTLFLKQAVLAGLCLGDIGEMLTRDHRGGDVTRSVLENVCTRAKDTTYMAYNDIDCGEEIEVGNKDKSDNDDDDDDQMFHFDEECEENDNNNKGSIMAKPPLSQSSNKNCVRAVTNKFDPMMVEANKCVDFDTGIMKNKRVSEGVDIKGKDRSKMGNLFKSISFAAPCPKKHEEKGVLLGDMNEQEWKFFIEMFQRLLPEVLEERKSNGITQRLGSA